MNCLIVRKRNTIGLKNDSMIIKNVLENINALQCTIITEDEYPKYVKTFYKIILGVRCYGEPYLNFTLIF